MQLIKDILPVITPVPVILKITLWGTGGRRGGANRDLTNP